MQRKKLLVLSFFPAFFPAHSGGEQRLGGFYRSLSKFHDITLLSWTFPEHQRERIQHCEGFEEIRFPKNASFVTLHQHFDQEVQLGGDVSALICAIAGESANPISDWMQTHKQQFDLIIHESPFTATCDDDIGSDGIPRVYMSYNVEWRMFDSYYSGAWKTHYIEYAKRLEGSLALHASKVFAVSEEDRQHMIGDFDLAEEKVGLTPSGITVTRLPVVARKVRTACFMGSGHPPNVIAAEYIVSVLAPQCADWTFVVIGSVCDAFADKQVPANVELRGRVTEEDKVELLCSAQLLLNPMTAGSGTNIKMLDYLAHGGAILTTPFGARGLKLDDDVNALVAELDAWPARIATLDVANLDVIGRAGCNHVDTHFSWQAIAAACSVELISLIGRGAPISRPLIVALNDFGIDVAQAGGAMRIRSLLTELAMEFRVVFLAMNEHSTQRNQKLAFGLSQDTFLWPDAMCDEQKIMAGRSWISAVDIVAARHCASQTDMVARLRELLPSCRYVLLEHCYIAPVLQAATAGWTAKEKRPTVVYESLNVERDLKRVVLATHPDLGALIATVDQVEELALDLADQVVCVTRQDAMRYQAWKPGKRVDVIENGVRIEPVHIDTERIQTLRVVFIGSGHPPNIEAASFISQRLAPICPGIEFTILGSCVSAIRHLPTPENVALVGEVNEAEKRKWFARSHVGINPILSGGGSSLKVADYMANSLVVVSSGFGFRGYDVVADEHLLVAGSDSPESFKLELDLILRAHSLAAELRNNASRWVSRHLSWQHLGERYRKLLTQRRVLALTYRFTSPPLGGAETYLFEVLKRLDSDHHWLVDVATSDTTTVNNHHHFGTQFGKSGRGDHCDFVNRVVRFEHEAPTEEQFLLGSRQLMAAWEQEWPYLFDQCAEAWKSCPTPLLLDGWYWPEGSGANTVRWCSTRARIWIPPGITEIKVSFGIASKATLVFATNQASPVVVASGEVVKLPSTGTTITLSFPQYDAPRDPRCLAAMVRGIDVAHAGTWSDLSLVEDGAGWLGRNAADAWTRALVSVARSRAAALDERFLQLRGPNCRGLSEWLSVNAKNYDAIIVHGVPFSMPAQLSVIKSSSATPTILLPHFHVEDRYYHWNTYYASMQLADAVVLAPKETCRLLDELLPINARWLPGGGTDQTEFTDRASAIAAFAAHRKTSLPFFLVLGRKSGNKRYQAAIAALKQLNCNGSRADLVLIGHDGDGVATSGPNVHYLGALPRQAVVGALYLCTALVSMSESESFGIVITEAWMTETPVIVSNHSAAFRELVSDRVNGRLVEDIEELTEAMAEVLSEPELAQAWGRAGKAEAIAHYTWDALATDWSELLDAITAAPATNIDKVPNTKTVGAPIAHV